MLVVGGGNAGLCAAISAAERGARVLLLERASQPWRGGNSKYTRDVRVAGDEYPDQELLADLRGVAGGGAEAPLAPFTVSRSRTIPAWMEAHGVRWQAPLGGTLQLSRTNRFFLGGGKALVNQYFDVAQRLGVEVLYEAKVVDFELRHGEFRSALVERAGRRTTVEARAVVFAAGGFEADLGWLEREWGEGARNFQVRGSRENDGLVLSRLLERGALERGNRRGFHCVACDARSPRYEGGIVTRVDSIPLGIVVNREGRRFHDEGEELWPKRYASWGGLVAEQPGQIAYSILDRRALGRFLPPLYPPLEAGSIGDLARQLDLDPASLCRTVEEYNAGVRGDREIDTTRLDGVATHGVAPRKSNWARRLEAPPFLAYPLRPGVTFTYLAAGVDESARVQDATGSGWTNVFAAGEVMAGNILSAGYLAGFGLTIGTVFGRVAGEEAARRAGAA